MILLFFTLLLLRMSDKVLFHSKILISWNHLLHLVITVVGSVTTTNHASVRTIPTSKILQSMSGLRFVVWLGFVRSHETSVCVCVCVCVCERERDSVFVVTVGKRRAENCESCLLHEIIMYVKRTEQKFWAFTSWCSQQTPVVNYCCVAFQTPEQIYWQSFGLQVRLKALCYFLIFRADGISKYSLKLVLTYWTTRGLDYKQPASHTFICCSRQLIILC